MNSSAPLQVPSDITLHYYCGNHQGPDETRRSVANTQSRYVNLDKFDGKVGEWHNWYHQFEFLATYYNWDDWARLVRLVSCLEGPALTAHRSFSQIARNTYAHCIAALHERYGSRRHALIITGRAELSTVRQEEGENMERFGDRVNTLTNQAYPFLVNDPTILQNLSMVFQHDSVVFSMVICNTIQYHWTIQWYFSRLNGTLGYSMVFLLDSMVL